MDDKLFKVVFMPSGKRGEFPQGTPVLDAARKIGVDVDSVCGGRGLCGRCQVLCTDGNFSKHGIVSAQTHLSVFTETEARYSARRKPLAAGRRLSCQARIEGDLLIDVPPESQVHRQVVRKDADEREIRLDSTVHLYYVEVQEADMHDPRGDLQRLYEALEAQWQLTDLSCDMLTLRLLQPSLRAGKWAVTVAVYDNTRVIAIWPGYREEAYGVSIDVGSTTIAAHLSELKSGRLVNSGSTMNPQIRFGEDLMSRVSYVMMHPEGAQQMTEAVREGINGLIEQVTGAMNTDPGDVMEITLVGNPIMHHLLLGVSPLELGGAPFALSTDAAITLPARELELSICSGGMVYVLPCIAGHVGADCAAVVLSEQPHLQDKMTLLVDIGTNAEIVLGNRERVVACSSPTGPAFEGAQISCGQRAAPGAIERVRVDPDTLEARVKVIGCDLWSDDPQFASETANIGVNGICGSGIIEAIAEMYLAGIVLPDGVINGALAERSSRIVRNERTWSYVLHDDVLLISVSQNDVRQIQLAKAALYAGVQLLMGKLSIEAVEKISLAGAFGSHIDVKHAMVLGLIPDCELAHVNSVGNAAGTGARIALLNKAARREIEALVKRIEKIETAIEPQFQQYFVDAMSIPHSTAPFNQLFSVVQRPAPPAVPAPEQGGTRRRRRRRPTSDN